jgi:hypothetical protein
MSNEARQFTNMRATTMIEAAQVEIEVCQILRKSTTEAIALMTSFPRTAGLRATLFGHLADLTEHEARKQTLIADALNAQQQSLIYKEL